MLLRLLAAAVAIAAATGPVAAQQPGDGLVRVRLIAERTAAVVELTPAAGWHLYWRNPGDGGDPPRIAWTLPAGVTAGEPAFPVPERIPAGDLASFGYTQPLRLVVSLAGTPAPHARLRADLTWLVCAHVCVPGRGSAVAAFPAGPPAAATAALVAQARAHLPQPAAFETVFAAAGDDVQLRIPRAALAGREVRGAFFFPLQRELLVAAAPQPWRIDGDALLLTLRRSDPHAALPATLDGLVTVAFAGGSVATTVSANPGVAAAPALSAAAALLLAFAGGLLLNLMPCVFPVLSFKALQLVAEPHGRRWPRAGAYTAGVVASCSALGIGLLAARAGGHALGWGFQLQSPWFVAALATLLLVLALAMSGRFELVIPLPAALARRGPARGLAGAFGDGALVALIGSACTAPYMGAALGFALTAPAAVAVGVFAALGLGLALPYALVTTIPAIAARLPRPGAWMVAARRILALPLYATVVWLVWVLAQQLGPVAPHAGTSALAAEAYAPERLAALERAHRPVLIDLSAAWCITCQVNERLALGRPEVARRLADLHVTVLRGDWTNQDPRITALLERYGRSGVPLYVYEPGDGSREVWPQLLTVPLVLDRLSSARPSRLSS